tara:strand:+ start:452 stop:826 length:375 start_codon:yes stop_codon:yes gene_type:complete
MRIGKHLVLVDDPHITSMASLIYLTQCYRSQELSQWFKFKKKLLDQCLEDNNGKLVCAYCGRDDLIEEIPKIKQPANLATIDHIIPLSRGGAKMDKSNCVISCHRCNYRKSDIEVESFKKGNLV